MAMAAITGSAMAATDAGAVAVVVPETAIGSPQYGPVLESSAAAPALACNADGCLAAWRDGRQGLGYRIWARRLRADGTARDPAAFLVSVDTFDASDPVLATDGTRFLVGWSDGSSKVYLTRVDADDSLHSESANVNDGSGGFLNPAALASSGDGYLFVYARSLASPPGGLKALRADRDGHILDATPIVITDDPTARGLADIVWTGTQYLVVWNQGQGDGGDAYAVRVRADGTVLDASGYFVASLAGFSNRPRLALGGGKVLLVNGRSAGYIGGQVGAVLLETDGRNGRAVTLPNPFSQTSGMTAAAAWNGSAFVVTWIDGSTTRPVGVRVAPDGTVIDAAQIALAGGTQTASPAIAVSGTTAFITYFDMSYQASPIRVVSLSATGVVGHTSDPPLDASAAPQRLLAAARGNGHTLVVWADDAQGTRASALLAARISDDGAVLDATPIVLSAATPNKQGAVAAAAWAGGQYLVSWWERNGTTTDQFQVARVSAAGELRDAPPTPLAQNVFFSQVSAIAPSGDAFLVVWSQSGVISTPPPINAMFIGPDGKPMGAGFAIGPTQASYPWAVFAAAGGGFLAAWNRYSGPYGVEMESIDAAGVQGTPVLVSGQQGSVSLALSPSPGRALVWRNGRAGMVVSPAPPFMVLPGTSAFDVGHNIGTPSWNGAVYVSAGVTMPGLYVEESAGVDVTVMSMDGVVDPPTTIVPPRQLTTLAPIAVPLAPDRNLVLYTRLVPEHDYGALRLRFQIVDSARPSSNPDGGVTDSGPGADALDAMNALDAASGTDAGDASGDDLRDAQDAPAEAVRPDVALADATADASAPDLGRPDAPATTDATPDAVADAPATDAARPDVAGGGDAPAPRDAVADVTPRDAAADTGGGSSSSSGCSCALSADGAGPDRGRGDWALVLFGTVACLRRRAPRRRR